ncbi:MAG TPA: glycoside hydrolase family 2 TIM barrel-domain containing protein [Planctomycetota bacterium]|nr:glycoside hydrolase family 2 TIM barrel-domain containing protein [Planctomycetota bacterium]
MSAYIAILSLLSIFCAAPQSVAAAAPHPGASTWAETEQNAVPPQGENPGPGKEPIEVLSDTRGQICLNGIWQFVPMREKAETEPSLGMAGIHVPGSWKESGGMPGLVSGPGSGPAWQNWGNGSGVWCAWYQRKITVPSSWAGRAIVVSLERVSTDAIVYANGEKCGAIAWPSGEVDISKTVKAGDEALLRIQVIATTDDSPSTTFLDPGRVVTTAAKLSSKGLIGNVFLRSRPPGTHISDVFVQCSTRKKELRLEVEVSEAGSAEPVQVTARLIGPNGQEEKSFQASAPIREGKTQTLQLSWTWANPKVWDLQQPNLYSLRLKCQGATWKDEYAQPFGFREFWIEGRKFYLNGTELRLRPTCHTYMETRFGGNVELTDAHLDGCLLAGFNIEECWPVNHDEKGSVHFRELWADRADLKGFLLMGTALPIDEGKWDKAGYREIYRRKLEQDLRRYRNHPSIVLWTTNPNWLGNGLDQDPRHIGRSEEIPGAIEDWKKKKASEAVSMIKNVDPTRPVFNHAGANNGDLFNINCYLNFMPLQEREELLGEWAKSGDMPLLCCEFGTPWSFSFLRGRWGFEGSTEPLMTEYSAIYLGREAYALETPDYRQAIRRKYAGGQRFGDWINGETVLEASPAFQKMEALFNRNTWRSWRTWGITGGMVPWDYGFAWDAFNSERRRTHRPVAEQALRPFTPGMRGVVRDKETVSLLKPFQPDGMDTYPAGTALMEANGPTLAWIAGPKDSFTAKDHSFSVGQEMMKQVVLINDERSPRDYSYTWTAELGGKSFASAAGKGRIEPAATLFLPLRVRLPDLTGPAKAAGTVSLVARIGAREQKDVFSFHVFSKATPLHQTVALFDPVGKTAKMLESLGCKVETWDGKSSSDLIVVGRESLSAGALPPFDWEAILRAGGHVLVCAQDPAWFREKMGFRVAAQLSRRVFPVSALHPVCLDLDGADLSDWAGESSLVDAHPHSPVQDPRWRSPKYGFHWGNRGVVTSAALEKPHRSGWRPILECGFDLAYSPLLELDYGPQGRLLVCTLDLEDHVPLDPAAALLAKNLLRYSASAPSLPRAKRTILVGDEQDRKVLEDLGVLFQGAEGLDPDADLAILGRQVKCSDVQVQEFLTKGRKMLFLPRSTSDPEIGLKLKEEKAFRGSLNVPPWPECQGLSPSDLHWRTEGPAWVLDVGFETGADGLLGLLRKGAGVALFCQIDPDRLEVDQKQYFRITRWRETRALAQILGNLGARFRGDQDAVSLTKPPAGLYHPDYHATDPKNSDDPYLYFRW